MTYFSSTGVTETRWDYEGQNFNRWRDASICPPSVEVKKKADIGMILVRGHDLNYFQPGFGDALNSDIEVSMNRTGEFFSRAYNVRVSIDEFMNPDVHTNSKRDDMGFVYHKLKQFAKKKGYNSNFNITGFGTGFSEKKEIAAVITLGNKDSIFIKSNDFPEYMRQDSKKYSISEESARLYTMMHEFMHLFGVGGSAKSEAKLEKIIADFCNETIKDIYSAHSYDEGKKAILANKMREIMKIAEARAKQAYATYSGKGMFTDMKESYSQSMIEGMISRYTREAMEKGYNTQSGITEYVGKKIKEEAKKQSNKGENKKSAKKKEKGQTKKKAKSSKN